MSGQHFLGVGYFRAVALGEFWRYSWAFWQAGRGCGGLGHAKKAQLEGDI